MIAYQKEPLSMADSSRLKSWLTKAEVQLFKDCVVAQMNEHYMDAINLQTKSTHDGGVDKFGIQSSAKILEAKDVQLFIRLFEKFSHPEYGFHKIKVQI